MYKYFKFEYWSYTVYTLYRILFGMVRTRLKLLHKIGGLLCLKRSALWWNQSSFSSREWRLVRTVNQFLLRMGSAAQIVRGMPLKWMRFTTSQSTG